MKPNSTSLIHCLRKLAAPQSCAELPDPQLLEQFLTHRSEAAFATLVRRHGPMVLNVCRRILHHDQDAEDAFQATFLVLAQKAGSIRKQQSLGSWLHGVAYRLARTSKAKEVRRLARQRGMPLPQSTDAGDDIHWHELRLLLDEELGKLPAKYRNKPITGVVRDKANGKPLAGIRIVGRSRLAEVRRFWPRDLETFTDAKGVYRLTGLPKDNEYSLYAADPKGASYLPWGKEPLDTAGLGPLKIDFELERGVCIEGRLLDKANGKPVSGRVNYAPLPRNPRIVGRQREAFRRWLIDDLVVGKDGVFKFVAYPGPGIVYAEAATAKYLPISFALEDKKLGLSVEAVSFTVGGWDVTVKGHDYRLIEPEADTKTLKCNLFFRP